jgi:hypothetical protein
MVLQNGSASPNDAFPRKNRNTNQQTKRTLSWKEPTGKEIAVSKSNVVLPTY